MLGETGESGARSSAAGPAGVGRVDILLHCTMSASFVNPNIFIFYLFIVLRPFIRGRKKNIKIFYTY